MISRTTLLGALYAVLGILDCFAAEDSETQVMELLLRARVKMNAGRYSHAETYCEAVLFLDSMNPIANAMMSETLANLHTDLPAPKRIRTSIIDDSKPKYRIYREISDQAHGRLAPFEPRFLQ